MILLDENFPDDQRALLRGWGIANRQIGVEIGHLGLKDENIIPLLHGRRRVTLFTQDEDFFLPKLRHDTYCLVWLDVRTEDLAGYLSRFLRHPRFNTAAKRMGIAASVHHDAIDSWQRNQAARQRVHWPTGG